MKKLFLTVIAVGLIQACEETDIIPTLKENEATIMEVVDEQNRKSDDAFMIVEEQPTYPGGQTAWMRHLANNLNYPEKAKQAGIEGVVYLSFVVDKDGSLEDFQVLRGIGGGCDEEALRVLMESEKWNPGKQRGEVVKARMQVRVVFSLGGDLESDPVMISTDEPTIQKRQTYKSAEVIEDDPDVFKIVEERPTYPGGQAAWVDHLQANLNYPEKAKNAGIEGEVILSFIVDKDGSIVDPQVIRGIGAGCDEEALKVLKASKNWNPAKQRGEIVKARMQTRIVFRMAP